MTSLEAPPHDAHQRVAAQERIHRELYPAEQMRFRQRTSVELVNARFKDEF